MHRAQEIELKLEIDSSDAAALRAHPLLSGHETKAARQVSTYFDTGEGALRKAGFSLRVRKSGDRTSRRSSCRATDQPASSTVRSGSRRWRAPPSTSMLQPGRRWRTC